MRVWTVRLLSCALFVSAVTAAEIPTPPEKIAPGMERGAWAVEAWGNQGTAERVTSDGLALLKLNFSGGEKGKTAFRHASCFGVAKNGKVRVLLFSSDDKPCSVAIVLCPGPKGEWHESRAVELQKGWNKLEFAVGANEWKTEASGWKNVVAVDPSDDIRAVSILVHNGRRSGELYVAGLSYDPDERGEKIAAFIKDLRSDDRSRREQAEKELIACGRHVTEPLLQLGDGERPEVLLRAACVLRDIEQQK